MTHGGPYWARYGNDGDLTNCDTNASPQSVVHTQHETNPWFAVDLGVALQVAGVRLTNRANYAGKCAVPVVALYRGVATGVFIPPPKKKSAHVNFLWGKNDVRTSIQQFYTPKNFYTPQNKFLATPLAL